MAVFLLECSEDEERQADFTSKRVLNPFILTELNGVSVGFLVFIL